jgi:UDP-3-O-[3-hydroxymyristoyl] glucosamine N-acyltransferase
MARFTLSELRARLGGEIQGDADLVLTGVGSLENAQPGQLGFVVGARFVKTAQASRASALLVSPGLAPEFSGPCLIVANPHAAFAQAIALFHPPPAFAPGIDPGARIGAECRIHPSVSIAPGVIVGDGVSIGARSRIDPGVVIADRVAIGEDCRLFANVSIYADCHLGDRVSVHAGAVIGADGFGLAWENGRWSKVPQVGRALIGNDVEIGANTTIDRGALDDTVIEDGVKIDNLVQIGHNCRIGAHTAIAGCAGLAGSTVIGSNCLIGGGAGLAGHLELCAGVTVSGGTHILKSIRTPGVYTSTQPQMPHDEWLKNAAQLRHLAELRERIRELERQVSDVRNQGSEEKPTA